MVRFFMGVLVDSMDVLEERIEDIVVPDVG